MRHASGKAGLTLAFLMLPSLVAARATPDPLFPIGGPDGIHVTDGSYVMSISQLQVNITNFGLIGSHYSVVSTFSDAPSAQWPSGSGIEYLFGAGLWIGGLLNGEKRVSTGEPEHELRPREGPENTIYEVRYGKRVRPFAGTERQGARIFEPNADDDHDGRINEETVNGIDDDGDGLIDEDFAMMGDQMMVCTEYDNTALSREAYRDHEPMNLRVVQTAYAWEAEDVDDFVVFSFDITNVGATAISGVYLGFYADPDIGRRDRGESAYNDMAGRFNGRARATNGIFENVDVAYMYDGPGRDHVPGYFGVMFSGPKSSQRSIRSMQIYSGDRAYLYGGEPLNDSERYEELVKTRSDAPTEPGAETDYRFLVSNGPWGVFYPGKTFHIEVLLVCGDGLEGLLENCANARQVWAGSYYDLDHDPNTGVQGHESLLCLEAMGYTMSTFQFSPFATMSATYGDASCVPDYWIHPITKEDLTFMPNGMHCIWVNTDNCSECERIVGRPCSVDDFRNHWNCNRWWLSLDQLKGCTGVLGRESPVRWLAETAPAPPVMRAWSDGNAVHVVWNNDSEGERDIITGNYDFESYRIWRADNWDRPAGTSEATGPAASSWRLLAEYDLDNDYVRTISNGEYTAADTVPLGANTGLRVIEYRPSCLDDPQYAGLREAMDEVVSTTIHDAGDVMPPLRDPDGAVQPGMWPLVPWEGHQAVLDTFYWTTSWENPSDAQERKRAKRFYEYVDPTVHNGFLYFYSVVATDHDMIVANSGTTLTGPGVAGDPSTSFVAIRAYSQAVDPAEDTMKNRVFVYPNPATRKSLAEFQQMYPNGDDPTGVRVMFTNLPRSHNTVRIFTIDGDLVQTLDHDGTTGDGDISWNLVSRNGQQVVSGIYLYVVHSDDPRLEDFIDKFVVIR